jgi:hypothetical protein
MFSTAKPAGKPTVKPAVFYPMAPPAARSPSMNRPTFVRRPSNGSQSESPPAKRVKGGKKTGLPTLDEVLDGQINERYPSISDDEIHDVYMYYLGVMASAKDWVGFFAIFDQADYCDHNVNRIFNSPEFGEHTAGIWGKKS